MAEQLINHEPDVDGEPQMHRRSRLTRCPLLLLIGLLWHGPASAAIIAFEGDTHDPTSPAFGLVTEEGNGSSIVYTLHKNNSTIAGGAERFVAFAIEFTPTVADPLIAAAFNNHGWESAVLAQADWTSFGMAGIDLDDDLVDDNPAGFFGTAAPGGVFPNHIALFWVPEVTWDVLGLAEGFLHQFAVSKGIFESRFVVAGTTPDVTVAVPEPGGLVLGSIAVLALLRLRRRLQWPYESAAGAATLRRPGRGQQSR